MKKRFSGHRPLSFQKNYLTHAEGSCLVSMGRTKVLCVASVEDEVPPHAKQNGTGWLHAEYAMLPRAGVRRGSRIKLVTGGRSQEISRLIGRALRAAIRLEDLGPRTIQIDCDVIQADGGTRTASINGAFIALVLALEQLKAQGLLSKWPLKDFIAAVSIGLVKGKVVLDMSYEDDKIAETDLNLVMTGKGQFVELQATAEGRSFSDKELASMIGQAKGAIRSIVKAQMKTLGKLPL